MQPSVLVVLAILAVAFISSATAAVASCGSIGEWSCFKERFNKTYETAKDEAYRKSVFQSNLEKMEKLNKKSLTFTVGLNSYSDYTNEERRKMHLGYRSSKSSSTNGAPTGTHAINVGDLPKSIDWREKGFVTPVKDQGECGSCWAFSATGSMEGAHFNATGKLVSLSVQQLIDCSSEGCDGGEMQDAFVYVIYSKGIDSEEQYPYKGREAKSCRFKKPPAATFSDYVNVESGSEAALQKAVAEIGPISVAMQAMDSFMDYKGGVYFDKDCNNTSEDLDHAILVVGYNTTEDGQDYWIVKNSWSSSWGIDGYGWMARNRDNNCGTATDASYPVGLEDDD